MSRTPVETGIGPRRKVRAKIGEWLARAARRLGSEGEGGRTSPTGTEKQVQLEEAQRIAGVGSWDWEIPTNRITWSDELFRICGHEPRSFEPDLERFMATIHPEDRERVHAIVERALEDHQPFSYEFRVVRPDGVERLCHARGGVFTDAGGAPVRMAGTHQDITERKAIEGELELHRDRLEDAQRIARIGSWDWDIRADRVTWSDQLFRVSGFEPQSFVPDVQRFIDTIHPDDRDRVRGILAIALEDHQPFSYDFRIVRPDGSERFSQARGNVVTDPAGVPVRMAGTSQDVTERKALEEELLRATAASAAAEAASVAKGEFLANMSHELRTPLNSVIGFANVLLKNKSSNLGATDLQYLERIRANGEHLLELINDILDLSKIEVGKMEAEVERFSLSELVEETIAGLRGAVRDDTVDLRAILPDSMTPLATDRGKLKQILINLIGNALKFTEEGEVTVQVYADAGTHRPERIEVRDTGVGIPQDRLAAIFGAFEQADTGTGRRFGGTGLGLTIVTSLAELLGFQVEVESEPGVGSTFRVLLPSDRAETAGVEAATRPSHPADLFPTRLPTGDMKLDGRLVLVIDDDTDSRILLTHDLEESGARTITASTGEQGIRMAREFRPDIITLDLLLPGMTGWEILRALKSDPGLQDIPVVIVSVVAHEDRGSVMGAADVIEKPIDRDELIAALRRTLSELPRRILIVDDAPDARDLLSSYLENEGAEIRTASDGLEALRVLESYTPDLVLLDLLMPNLDGIAVIKKLNEREPYRSIPVIVVTDKDLTAEEEECLSKSAMAVLRKGARLEEGLREALEGIL
jgi:PAS domain S-box-containing protein